MQYLPLLQLSKKQYSNREFVDFWKSFYSNDKENDQRYTNNINKTVFTPRDIDNLFWWKNGMKINDHPTKSRSVGDVKEKIKHVNALKERFDPTLFKDKFGKMGVVWQIFLLHIINPGEYPIYDQHVYRAYHYLHFGVIEEIPATRKTSLEFYHEKYRPFFKQFRPRYCRHRDVDLALWCFGKFLISDYGRAVLSN